MTTLAATRKAGCQPRYATPRSPDRATLGPAVAQVAEALGQPFMPHQRALMDVALEINPETGCLAYGEVVLIGPRQATGKSFMLLPLMTHRCVGFTPALAEWVRQAYGHAEFRGLDAQRVLFLAQTADDARLKWRRNHLAKLQRSRFKDDFVASLTQNKEVFSWRNGALWSPGSATAKTAGTGDSVDLGVIDEYWSHKDNRTELGLRPAMMTRQWRQLWKCSMVPGLSRVLPHEWQPMRAAMAAGRARVEADIREGVCYYEFSAEEGLDPGDPATWWSCLPALGYGVDERTIREDFLDAQTKGTLVDFEAEYLGWAPKASTPRWELITEATWGNCYDANSAAVDPVAIGLAMPGERSLVSISVAALREDGRVHVELIDRLTTELAVARVAELVETHAPCAVAFDPAMPEASLMQPLRDALAMARVSVPLLTPNIRDVCQVSAQVFDATGQVDPGAVDLVTDRPVRLHHIGQGEMSRAVAGAIKDPVGGQWRFKAVAGGIDISPLRAAALAWWAGQRAEWAGGNYDIRSTLG